MFSKKLFNRSIITHDKIWRKKHGQDISLFEWTVCAHRVWSKVHSVLRVKRLWRLWGFASNSICTNCSFKKRNILAILFSPYFVMGCNGSIKKLLWEHFSLTKDKRELPKDGSSPWKNVFYSKLCTDLQIKSIQIKRATCF